MYVQKQNKLQQAIILLKICFQTYMMYTMHDPNPL